MACAFRRAAVSLAASAALAAAGMAAGAEEGQFRLDLGANAWAGTFSAKPGVLSDGLRGVLGWAERPFALVMDLSFLNDGKYPSHNVYELGHYFRMDQATVSACLGGLRVEGGRGPGRDELEGPYSLVLSGAGLSAPYASIRWEGRGFSYETRWISLNANAKEFYEGTVLRWLDRGLNYKVYSFRAGDFRFGYQDSSVYVGQVFDFEGFASPLPAYIQQMALASSGRPYSTAANPNSLMGFFGEWARPEASVRAQFLVDDVNASFLAPLLGWAIPALEAIDNVQKVAWSLDGGWKTGAGTFTLRHAGATKYCFESTYTSVTSPSGFALAAPDYNPLPYPYAYYPATTYDHGTRIWLIPPRDNWIGYRHGENNIAFMVSWEGRPGGSAAWGFDAGADLEYSVTGSQSPANPWHELDTWEGIGKAFVLLDEKLLEHSLLLEASLSKAVGRWTFSAMMELGCVWNPLAPEAVPGRPDEAKIWRPQADEAKPVCGISLGAFYRFGEALE